MEKDPSQKNKTINPISRYDAPEDELNYKEFQVASWFVRHKLLLEKIFIWMLITWSVVTIGYSIFKWGEYFIFGLFDDRDLYSRQVNEIENYTNKQPLYAATPLDIRRPDIFTVGEKRYSFITQVFNPNERWKALVRFTYVYSGIETEEFTQVIMPGQLQLLAVHGQEGESFPSQARVIVKDITWSQIDPHKIPDVKGYLDARLDFEVGNINFIRRNTGGIPTDQLQFTLTNKSAYSYWQPVFHLGLFNGQKMVGVRTITLDEFRSGQVEDIDLRFGGPQITISSVDIVPSIDIFDEDVYMDPGS